MSAFTAAPTVASLARLAPTTGDSPEERGVLGALKSDGATPVETAAAAATPAATAPTLSQVAQASGQLAQMSGQISQPMNFVNQMMGQVQQLASTGQQRQGQRRPSRLPPRSPLAGPPRRVTATGGSARPAPSAHRSTALRSVTKLRMRRAGRSASLALASAAKPIRVKATASRNIR